MAWPCPLTLPFFFHIRYCSSLYSHCRRELLVNVTGQPYLILDIDDWTKKPTASIQTQHGSVTTITKSYSTQKMDVEFLGDQNIFIHVDLQVRFRLFLLLAMFVVCFWQTYELRVYQKLKVFVLFWSLALPEWMIECCKVVLNFESVDEIIKCDHSSESYWAVLSSGIVYYAVQGGPTFWVWESNPVVWPLKRKLLSCTFLWYCLLCCTRWSYVLSLRIKSNGLTIQMKVTEQYFHKVLLNFMLFFNICWVI